MSLEGPLTKQTRVKTIRTPQSPLQEYTRSHSPTLRPSACALKETRCLYLPEWEILQPASWRIQDIPPKQLAMTQHTPFDQCFKWGSQLHGKTAYLNDPWLPEVRSPQPITAQGFQPTNTDTPQWPHKLPRFRNKTRACRFPNAPCLFLSVNNSGLIGPRTLVFTSWI